MPCFWMVAAERPSSLTRSRIAPSAATMASRPKAVGGNKRTSTIRVASWPSTRTAWAPRRMVPPRRDLRPMSSTRWSVARWSLACTASGDGARSLGNDMVNVPPVGRGQAFAQGGARLPAERCGERRIHHLARHAVGTAGIELHAALVAHDLADQADEIDDRHVGTGAEIDDRLVGIVLHQVHHAVRGIVDIEELPAHRAGAPDLDGRRAGAHGRMRLDQQRRHDMAL